MDNSRAVEELYKVESSTPMLTWWTYSSPLLKVMGVLDLEEIEGALPREDLTTRVKEVGWATVLRAAAATSTKEVVVP